MGFAASGRLDGGMLRASGFVLTRNCRSTPKPNVSKASAKVQTDQHLGSYNSSLRSLQLCN